MGEQKQQYARAQRQRRGERPEGARQHLRHGVHTAVPEAREDARAHVQQAYECAGSADEDGNGLRARAPEKVTHAA
ncbi:hypothetical protein GCM10018783_53390 [Streptomyces griseosporeus]|nr:hypothetical protein GCM10018783_53390 [Streptomyces griseosporeus]